MLAIKEENNKKGFMVQSGIITYLLHHQNPAESSSIFKGDRSHDQLVHFNYQIFLLRFSIKRFVAATKALTIGGSSSECPPFGIIHK